MFSVVRLINLRSNARLIDFDFNLGFTSCSSYISEASRSIQRDGSRNRVMGKILSTARARLIGCDEEYDIGFSEVEEEEDMSEICNPKLNVITQSWSDLPEDLLKTITSHLASADRVRFGAVCRNFFQYYNSIVSNPKHNHWDIDRLPWLLRKCGDHTQLFDPIHQRLYYVHPLRLSSTEDGTGTSVVSSKKGWLLCSRENKEKKKKNTTQVSFYSVSLFTKELIRLPDLYVKHRSKAKFIRFAAFSSDPSSPDCVYLVVFQNIRTKMIRISTLHHGAGKWGDGSYHAMDGLVRAVVYYQGCFYLVTRTGNLKSYDVFGRIWTTHTHTGLRPLREPILRNDIREYYVVVSEHELLLVCLDLGTSKNRGNQTDDCSVFEFNRSSKRWVQKTSLGDRALFLGCSSFSVSANGMMTRSRGIDIANKVYYYNPMECSEPRYYSLDDGKCHKSTSSCWFGNVDAGMWIEPPQLPTMKFERFSQL